MRRRDLVILLVGAAVAWPFSARAQHADQMARIGFLSPRPIPRDIDLPVASFVAGLRDRGYVEGRTIAIEYRFADGQFQRLPDIAAELVRLKVEVIVAQGALAIRAAAATTTTIPIVMAFSDDPVRAGFVKSLARPGGNITGVVLLGSELGAKRLELIKAAFPEVARVAVLANPRTSAEQLEQLRIVAPSLGASLAVAEAQEPAELDAAFSTMMKDARRCSYH
jgi:putative tryptophan/tyrosine transport system substrate-binding protein